MTTYVQLFVGIVIVLAFVAAVIWTRRTFFATTPPVIDTVVGIFGLIVICWLLLNALGLVPFHDPKVPQVR